MNVRPKNSTDEMRRLSTASKRLARALDAARKLRDQIQKLSQKREQLSAQRDELESRDDYAIDRTLIRRAGEANSQCGAIDTAIERLEIRLADLEADTSRIVEDCREHYRTVLLPRIESQARTIAALLAPFYRGESKPHEIATRSDCIAYLCSHATCSGWDRTDAAFVAWFLERIDALLASPDSVPWPPPTVIPAGTPAVEMDRVAA